MSHPNLVVLYTAMIHMNREILCLIKVSVYTDFAVLNRKIILLSSVYKYCVFFRFLSCFVVQFSSADI